MKKCIVIGGGIAGLSTAAYLSKHGIKVTLLESSPKLGGRAYSYRDSDSGDIIDNGQHILMGCYKDTIKFLKLIGAKDNFYFNNRLDITFLKPGRKFTKLKALPFIYPLNLFIALLKFNAVSFAERISLLKFMMKIPFTSHQKLVDKNIYEWLLQEKQSENTIKSLWKIIAVGALNADIKKASAYLFREILMKIFFNGNFASTIILPKYGLTESYVTPAIKFIESNGGIIKLSSPVEEIITDNDKIAGIKTKDEVITEFDFVISSIPYYSLIKLTSGLFDEDIKFEHSSILNIHIWLKENQLKEKFYGLINSQVHWIFNKHSHLNLVVSDADYLMGKTSEDIFLICLNELKMFANIEEENIVNYKIIKEKRATFIPSNDLNYSRPSCKTKYSNFFLAGDWTNTGLPSTLESAVKSGRIASGNVIQY
jgi:squalene-associated FAD-dependent desaturase